jgi:predicted Ser/Thr protein kinase
MGKGSMKLDEFLALSEKQTTALFNAPQRLFASILRYGKKDGKWQFIYRQQDEDRSVNTLYGLDDAADEFVTQLTRATQNTAERSKVTIAVGPAGSGKNEFIKTLEETLKSYSRTEEGTLYKVRVYLDRLDDPEFGEFFETKAQQKKFVSNLRSKFGEMDNVLLSLGNNIQTVLYLFLKREDNKKVPTKIEETVGRVNTSTTEYWKRINIDKDADSSTVDFVKSSMLSSLESTIKDSDRMYEFLEKVITIEKADGQNAIAASRPPVSPSNKDLDFQAIFGGKLDYSALRKLGGNNSSAIAFNYGIAGGQSLPSPSGGLLVLSEMLKADSSFINTSLDFIQDRRVTFPPAFKESFDVVTLGSGNLDELPTLQAKVKSYLMSRLNVIAFPYPTKKTDIKKDLENIYGAAKLELDTHYSPRFLDMLSRVIVEAAIADYPNIPLKVNADMHNGAPAPEEIKVNLDEILRVANSKPILERTEGMKLGLPHREISSSPDSFSRYSRTILEKRKDKLPYKPCLDEVFSDNTAHVLEDFLNALGDVTPETAARLRTKIDPSQGESGNIIVQDAFEDYKRLMTSDVMGAYAGSEAIKNRLSNYVRQVFYLQKGMDKYIDDDGRSKPISEESIIELEKGAKVKSNAIRSSIYTVVNVGLQTTNKESGLTQDLINNAISFVLDSYPLIQYAAVESIRPKSGVVMKDEHNVVINRLKEKGYCDRCARIAINLSEQYQVRSKPKEQ